MEHYHSFTEISFLVFVSNIINFTHANRSEIHGGQAELHVIEVTKRYCNYNDTC